MRRFRPLPIVMLFGAIAFGMPAWAQEAALGADVESLLAYGKAHNPEFRVRSLDAEAQRERIEPASALPDPRFQVELMDFTNAMTPGKSASLQPGDVGTTTSPGIAARRSAQSS